MRIGGKKNGAKPAQLPEPYVSLVDELKVKGAQLTRGSRRGACLNADLVLLTAELQAASNDLAMLLFGTNMVGTYYGRWRKTEHVEAGRVGFGAVWARKAE